MSNDPKAPGSGGGGDSPKSHVPCPTVNMVTCPPDVCNKDGGGNKPVSVPPNCPSVHITCPECPVSHPAYSCHPCPTVHNLTCPPGHCPPSHPNVSCHPCPSVPCDLPTTQGCPVQTVACGPATHNCRPTYMFGCPQTVACPPTHMFGCTMYPTSPVLCPPTQSCPTHAPHLCPSLPFCPTETCPPTHLLGCTVYPTAPHLCLISAPGHCPTVGIQCVASGNPGCGQTITTPFQQTPQQHGGGGPQYYQGGRTGTYNPYGD